MNNQPAQAASAPVHRLVGRYFTCHTWSKINKLEINESIWYSECIKPLLDSGRTMPKRFMLYCDLRYPELWNRITHEYPDICRVSIDSMDDRARYNYSKIMHLRRAPNAPDDRAGDQP